MSSPTRPIPALTWEELQRLLQEQQLRMQALINENAQLREAVAQLRSGNGFYVVIAGRPFSLTPVPGGR